MFRQQGLCQNWLFWDFSSRSGVETQEICAEMVPPYRCERAKRLTMIFLQTCHGINATASSGFDS